MQAQPTLGLDGTILVPSSNHSQQRGTHGLFRFFGKLAPDVTGDILDRAASLVGGDLDTPIVDVMCGSGTTLIEAAERHWSSIGVDVNPAALLYASVKTRRVDRTKATHLVAGIEASDFHPTHKQVDDVFARTQNSQRWFTESARLAVAKIRLHLDQLDNSPERDLLLAVLLARLRRISNASPRTGRLFYDPGSAAKDVMFDYVVAVRKAIELSPEEDLPTRVILGDAADTGLKEGISRFVFCHPPYFGLYRFSADVLRFELEIGGWRRSEVAQREVQEGWKSGDVKNLDSHVADMTRVFAEGRRITRAGGLFVLVTSNSTLGDHQLPVVDRLAAAAQTANWRLKEHLERKAHFGSASYHRSARTDKVISRDHVLIFTAQ